VSGADSGTMKTLQWRYQVGADKTHPVQCTHHISVTSAAAAAADSAVITQRHVGTAQLLIDMPV